MDYAGDGWDLLRRFVFQAALMRTIGSLKPCAANVSQAKPPTLSPALQTMIKLRPFKSIQPRHYWDSCSLFPPAIKRTTMQRTTQTLITLALALAFAGNLHAAPTSSSRIYRPAQKYKLSKEERAQEDQRLMQISKRSQDLFALSSAEMALTKGDVKSAIGLYI